MLAIAGLIALGACSKSPADKAADNTASNLQNQAAAVQNAAENRADAVRNAADNRADRMESTNRTSGNHH